ncbi:hypothetical protein EST38_g8364 [Candolleomyces aberdarensis]|uniref:DUF1996 domain-containing protein n=1 Tax=Candolleomyces aberdarensis TaxID=2316362 RepID=A0A4Q2DCU7_9AGAR|nr:hypothetical protein EST38_g8364 [Candolleomyces aberdarensis]
MDPDPDVPNLATCTTCRFKEDKSNYWTAVIYFKHPNGSYIRVPQIPNHFTGEAKGGVTVYYIQPPDLSPVTAFRKVTQWITFLAPPLTFAQGFRMITGDAMYRTPVHTDEKSGERWATSFRCWESTGPFDYSNSHAIGPGPFDSVNLPNRPCLGGIRSNTFFPSCWDGVNLDSPDHKSHVAFYKEVDPKRGLFLASGTCPDSHPVRIPSVFYETVWDTKPFNGMWPEDGSQPLVLSMGDPTGFGHHGDYLFGWEDDSLQRAMDKCTGIDGWPPNCTELTLQTDEEMDSCTLAPKVDEKVEGEYLPNLPGCNPLQGGPQSATLVPGCTAVSTTFSPAAPTPAVEAANAAKPAAVTPAPVL